MGMKQSEKVMSMVALEVVLLWIPCTLHSLGGGMGWVHSCRVPDSLFLSERSSVCAL